MTESPSVEKSVASLSNDIMTEFSSAKSASPNNEIAAESPSEDILMFEEGCESDFECGELDDIFENLIENVQLSDQTQKL